MSYYYPEYVRLETAAGAGDNVSICFHERMEVVSAKIVDFAGVAEDAAAASCVGVVEDGADAAASAGACDA